MGQPAINTPGIDGWLNDVPVSLKEVAGVNGMLTVQEKHPRHHSDDKSGPSWRYVH